MTSRLKDDVLGGAEYTLKQTLAFFGSITTSPWVNLGLGPLATQLGSCLHHRKTLVWVVSVCFLSEISASPCQEYHSSPKKGEKAESPVEMWPREGTARRGVPIQVALLAR